MQLCLGACSLFGLVLLVSACATTGTTPAINPVVGADNPARYRYITLDNGLAVLLVSHPGAERAAAALSLAVGSRSDPPGYDGMAHFLEHMLFLGTDRYPGVGEYQKFLVAHGGRYNGYTAFEETNYFFSIHTAHFEEALKRFSRFFIAPLIDEEYVQREREAVDAEYHAGRANDVRRLIDVLKTQVNPAHPYARFAVGNLETLQGPGLHDVLREFYKKYYGADNMKLVLMSGQSLSRLSALAKNYFSEVPKFATRPGTIEEPLFGETGLGSVITLRPKRNERNLLAMFPIPDPAAHYARKPLYYISHMIGHEGAGSLLSLLKRRNLASALSSGPGFSYRGGATLDVNISLTERGQTHVDEVLGYLFDAIRMIRQSGIERWRFDELRAIAELDFRYSRPRNPLSHVIELSTRLHRTPPRDVLRAPYLFGEFDVDLIADYMSYLRPDNALLMVQDPAFEGTQYSPWYQVPYRREVIDSRTRQSWASRNAGSDSLFLPEQNPFIPRSTELYPFEASAADPEAPPRLLSEHPALQVWHKRDSQFRLPHVDTVLRMDFEQYQSSLKNKSLARLWAAVFGDMLNEYLYTAYLAGLGVSVTARATGIELSMSGYHDRQPRVLEHIMDRIEHFNPNEAQVRRVGDKLVRELRNTVNDAPYGVMHARLNQLLTEGGDTEWRTAKAIEGIELEALRTYGQSLLRRAQMQVLIHGNARAEHARALAAQLYPLVAQTSATALYRGVVRLPRGQTTVWHEHLAHDDTAVLLYVQAEDDTWRTRVMVELSRQILEADFFRELRTEQQLGYAVFMSSSDVMDLAGLTWTVQSPDSSAEILEQAIRDFIDTSISYAEHISTEEFETQRQTLVKLWRERPRNISEASAEWWAELGRARYRFATRDARIKAATDISREEWVDFYRDWLGSGMRRELLLYSSGASRLVLQGGSNRRYYDELDAYRREVATQVLRKEVW